MARGSLDSRTSIYKTKLRGVGQHLEHFVECRFLGMEHWRFYIIHFGKLLDQERKQADSHRDSHEDFSSHGGSIELVPSKSRPSSDQC